MHFSPHPGAYHLDDGAVGAAHEVHLAADEKLDVLDILSLLPAAREDVPLVRRRHDDVAFGQQLQVRRRLAGQEHSPGIKG